MINRCALQERVHILARIITTSCAVNILYCLCNITLQYIGSNDNTLYFTSSVLLNLKDLRFESNTEWLAHTRRRARTHTRTHTHRDVDLPPPLALPKFFNRWLVSSSRTGVPGISAIICPSAEKITRPK